MYSKKTLPLILLVVGVAVCICYTIWNSYRYIESTDNAYVQSDISTVSSLVLSSVTDIKVAENMPVKAGQVLVNLDKIEFAANLVSLEAELLAEQDAINIKKQNIIIQNSAIKQAGSEVVSATSSYQTALKNYDRDKNLAKDKFTSKQTLDDILNQVSVSKANLDKANEELAIQNVKLELLNLEISMENHKLDQIKAQIDIAKKQLSDCTIIAPVDGVVVNRSVELGNVVRPGSPITSIVPSNNAYITANFKETQVQNMQPGQSATIAVDAFPNEKYEGIVENISPATGSTFSLIPVQNATGNFIKIVQRVPVRIKISNQIQARKLTSGLSAKVTVNTNSITTSN